MARQLVREAKQASRRKFPAEEKIRILLEGLRAEVSAAELCRQEESIRWSITSGRKVRLRGGTTSKAMSEEVQQLHAENERLKQLIAESSLTSLTLKNRKMLQGFSASISRMRANAWRTCGMVMDPPTIKATFSASMTSWRVQPSSPQRTR